MEQAIISNNDNSPQQQPEQRKPEEREQEKPDEEQMKRLSYLLSLDDDTSPVSLPIYTPESDQLAPPSRERKEPNYALTDASFFIPRDNNSNKNTNNNDSNPNSNSNSNSNSPYGPVVSTTLPPSTTPQEYNNYTNAINNNNNQSSQESNNNNNNNKAESPKGSLIPPNEVPGNEYS